MPVRTASGLKPPGEGQAGVNLKSVHQLEAAQPGAPGESLSVLLPAALSSKLERSQVVSMAPLGLSQGVRCAWQEMQAWLPTGGVPGSPHPTLHRCTGERATACEIFVERGKGSSSNYHHSNYRIAPPTQCVQKRLGESPHDASPASGAGSREQALPGLTGLRRRCF